MSMPRPDHDRLLELLADRALFGLSTDEQRELGGLLTAMPDVDADDLDRIAAQAHLATMEEEIDLPTELRQKLVSQGRGMVAKTVRPPASLPEQRVSRREMFGWFAAAAALFVAAFFATRSVEQIVAELTPTELQAELAQSKDGLTKVAWSPGTDEVGKNATGEVLWNNKRQQGVMSFRGLPANDPKESQYQLWIFDTAQDEKYPVDGGVFDIPAGAKEVLIPIDAKLPIVEPTLFAITIEKSGGVVVSSRKRLPLLAQVAK
ncbi:MAG: anti-sigma factor [Bythopirellula sp.]|nr:anti-sigma factor [Bythopirellula sp.]